MAHTASAFVGGWNPAQPDQSLRELLYYELSARRQITCLIEKYDRVVCNTRPLIKLAGVGLHNLLPQIDGTIWIPEAVRDEYLVRAERAALLRVSVML